MERRLRGDHRRELPGGLPSKVEDDPLLALAMPAPERYPHAEERRLFYVALTRTRRSVLLLTLQVELDFSDSQLEKWAQERARREPPPPRLAAM